MTDEDEYIHVVDTKRLYWAIAKEIADRYGHKDCDAVSDEVAMYLATESAKYLIAKYENINEVNNEEGESNER